MDVEDQVGRRAIKVGDLVEGISGTARDEGSGGCPVVSGQEDCLEESTKLT